MIGFELGDVTVDMAAVLITVVVSLAAALVAATVIPERRPTPPGSSGPRPDPLPMRSGSSRPSASASAEIEPLNRLRYWFELDQRRRSVAGARPAAGRTRPVRQPPSVRSTVRLARSRRCPPNRATFLPQSSRPSKTPGENRGARADRRSSVEPPEMVAATNGDTITVALLGPIRIGGSIGPISDQQCSLITFLACSGPRSKLQIIEAMWSGRRISDSRFANLVSQVRSTVGRERLILRGDGRYEMVGVALDLDLFRGRVADPSHSLTPAAIVESRRGALSLVRGRLIDPPSTRHWRWLDTDYDLRGSAERLVADAAHELSSAALRLDDPATAEWACRRALTAVPHDEALVARLAEIHRHRGNHRAADEVVVRWQRAWGTQP